MPHPTQMPQASALDREGKGELAFPKRASAGDDCYPLCQGWLAFDAISARLRARLKDRPKRLLACAPGNATSGRLATENAPMATPARESAIARVGEAAEAGAQRDLVIA